MNGFNATAPRTRVLVAEHPEIMKAIANAQKTGEPVAAVSVRDGVQAMHTLLASQFDLAIVDLAMPSLDALRLISLIRATPQVRRLPILAVVPTRRPASGIEALEAGASDYIQRPVDWPQLVMRIRRLTTAAAA